MARMRPSRPSAPRRAIAGRTPDRTTRPSAAPGRACGARPGVPRARCCRRTAVRFAPAPPA